MTLRRSTSKVRTSLGMVHGLAGLFLDQGGVQDTLLHSIDLQDAYLHVPIHPALYRYLRLGISPTEVFHFRTLPFGLNTAPLVFTRIVERVAGYMRQMFSLHVHVYLDDWLLRHQQRETLLHLTPSIVQFLRSPSQS